MIAQLLNAAIWIAVIVAASTFCVETAFVYVSTAKRLLNSGVRLPLDMKMIAYFWLVVGTVADVVLNGTRGTWMFRELPREWLFSSRVQRHIHSTGRRKKVAIEWAEILNAIHPGHI